MDNRAAGATAALLVCAANLVACGGGGSGSDTPSSAPPPTPNTAPVALAAELAGTEDVVIAGTVTGQDAERDPMTFSLQRAPAHGVVYINPLTGQFTYTPEADFAGTDDFTFTVSDSRLSSAPGRVTLVLNGVSDPPDLSAFNPPGAGESGKTLVVNLNARDPDARIASYEVAFADGSPIPGLVLRTDAFSMPVPVTDHPVPSHFRLRVLDTDGNVLEREFTVLICPVSASGNVVTLAGDVASPGVQWVITGDGYTADERQQLLSQAFDASERVLSEPAVARHRAGWNVHVLLVASDESGIDVPSRNILRRTAFDGAVECGGVTRLACVDWAKVYDRVLPELAFDEMMVLLNSRQYAGAGYPEGAVLAFANGEAARVALHELGHTFAGLADEYVDGAMADGALYNFQEGLFPNVTKQRDASRFPWRHWLADPSAFPTAPGENGIGRFEGAYYNAVGFFRPADSSFMRDDKGPVTVVHAEAWVRALYRHILPGHYSDPAPGAVALTATPRRFSVVRTFPADVQSVRWFLDGTEIIAARDQSEYACCSGLDGSHTLRVDYEDITGAIRVPGASEGRDSIRWDLVIDANASGTASQGGKLRAAGIEAARSPVIIRMRIDREGHHVEGLYRSVPPATRPTVPGAAPMEPMRFTLLDSAGRTLSTGEVGDPRVVRAPLESTGSAGHAIVRLESGHYLIHASDGAGLRYLRIEDAGTSRSKIQAVTPPQFFDLAPLL